MSDKIELLPCPFCGGIDIGHSYIEAHSCDSSYRVFGCISCGARFEAGDAQNWNRRATLAQQSTPAAPVAQEPVAYVSQESFSSNGTSDIITQNLPIGIALYTAPPAAEQPDTVAVPRDVLRELADTAIAEWHDPSENEAAQDRNECLCCGVEDGHNADCAVAIALRLLGKEGE